MKKSGPLVRLEGVALTLPLVTLIPTEKGPLTEEEEGHRKTAPASTEDSGLLTWERQARADLVWLWSTVRRKWFSLKNKVEKQFAEGE